jgi:predicted TIM-barrel fold metal-dependent hydrolase
MHWWGLILGSKSSLLKQTATILAIFSTTTTVISAMPVYRVIDAHLHVWANSNEASSTFPYVQEPPENLRDCACTSALLNQMKEAGVDGALIVQPINYKFDHSYVIQAIQQHPDHFKGMMLHDPSMTVTDAVARLEELALAGFVGVRFNPYLWEKTGDQKWAPMSTEAGLAVYKRCGELGMPVGVMCFQGLSLHYDDILQLLQTSPSTVMVLDHFGFTSITDDSAFEQLLQLAKYPAVYVKISALFRLGDHSPYAQVYEKRFLPLLTSFGADRLMYGSDFPYVLEQPEAYKMNELVASWCKNERTRVAIMGETAERVFGPWGIQTSTKTM